MDANASMSNTQLQSRISFRHACRDGDPGNNLDKTDGSNRSATFQGKTRSSFGLCRILVCCIAAHSAELRPIVVYLMRVDCCVDCINTLTLSAQSVPVGFPDAGQCQWIRGKSNKRANS